MRKRHYQICEQLSPDAFINPHKSIFGFGNYDVNVVIYALQQQGFTVQWFDRRKSVGVIDLSKVFGFIVNYSSARLFSQVSKHWFAIRRIGNTFYNCDSKQDKPFPYPSETKLMEELQLFIEKRRAELLLVVENANAESVIMESQVPRTEDLEKLHDDDDERHGKEEEN